MKKLFASIAIAAIAVAPVIGFTAEDESDLTIPANEVTGAEIYVDVETGALYQESNDVEGLQTEAFEGSDDEAAYEADTPLL